MSGDHSRISFNRIKHFADLYKQQGRLPLEADFNEHVDIQAHLLETRTKDIVGDGVPITADGFKLSAITTGADQDLDIQPGRIYVGGIMCEAEGPTLLINPSTRNTGVVGDLLGDLYGLDAQQWVKIWGEDGTSYVHQVKSFDKADDRLQFVDKMDRTLSTDKAYPLSPLVSYRTQPDYPNAAERDAFDKPGVYLAYLDVWRRHVTAIEDDEIREIALGGPDTAIRLKTVWQVKLQKLEDANQVFNCRQFGNGWAPDSDQESKRGRLAVRFDPSANDASLGEYPCGPPRAEGYQLGNQLYRVEIHQGGKVGAPSDGKTVSFKWSRDNGSVAARWLDQNGNDLIVSGLGRNPALDFAAGDWVELTDDSRELWADPGEFVQVQMVEGTMLTLTAATASANDRHNFPRNPKVRLWDDKKSGEVPIPNDGWIPLEGSGGIQVKFDQNATYRTGDYWLIPARIDAEPPLQWPGGDGARQKRHGTYHHYCPIALVTRDDKGNLKVTDCRKHFYPAVENLGGLKACGVSVGDRGQYASLEEALIELLRETQQGKYIHVHLLPGDHTLRNDVSIADVPSVHIRISGCGPASRIQLAANAIRVANCASFTLENVDITSVGGTAPLTLESCAIVKFEKSNLLAQLRANIVPARASALLTIAGAKRISIKDCTLTACQSTGFPHAEFFAHAAASREVAALGFKGTKIFDDLSAAFTAPCGDALIDGVIGELTQPGDKPNLRERKSLAGTLRKVLEATPEVNKEDRNRFIALSDALAASQIDRGHLTETLDNLRHEAAAHRVEGVAVIFEDGNADTSLENNVIQGATILYGALPAKVAALTQLTQPKIAKDEAQVKKFVANFQAANFSASAGELRLLNNRFSSLVVSQQMQDQINNAVIKGAKKIEGVYNRGFLSNNTFGTSPCELIIQELALTSNLFFADPKDAGLVIADTVTLVGNQAFEDKLFVLSHRCSQAANLGLSPFSSCKD